MSYWDETDRIMEEHGGEGPPCPSCGESMFPVDDHGRFKCWGCGYANYDAPKSFRDLFTENEK